MENTIENNKLIVEFMGLKPVETFGKFSISKNHCTSLNETIEKTIEGFSSIAKYHSSWDWLMPIVEKIEALDYFCMINQWTSIYIGGVGKRISITTVEGPSKIKNTYIAVVKFIKWYNKNK